MPELPDIALYRAALAERVVGRRIERVQIISPFVLRTFEPPIEAVEGQTVAGVERLGKRIVLRTGTEVRRHEDEGDRLASLKEEGASGLCLVIHLMIAGRLRWLSPNARASRKITLASIRLANGTLVLTEASKQKRAALHLVSGAAALAQFDRGGLDVLTCDQAGFVERLRRENHTLKRALTDPRLFDGIGNAYSDEICHAARLSPIRLTRKLDDDESARLFAATRETLVHWTAKLQAEFAGRFPGPGDVTAFRPAFAVHGKYDQPCPTCGTRVQRIRYAENETNYCPTCQTGGKVLADRSLSRLLKEDWPRTVAELEDGSQQ